MKRPLRGPMPLAVTLPLHSTCACARANDVGGGLPSAC